MSRQTLPGLPDDYISKFFAGDVVIKDGDESRVFRVMRCWADEEGDDLAQPFYTHPMDRALLRGEIGVANSLNGELSLIPESSVSLYTRDFGKGNIVKRSLTSIESALVIDIKVEVKIEHAISKIKAEGWIPLEKFRHALPIAAGDYVVYDSWVGMVVDVLDEATAETYGGRLVKLPELGGAAEPGAKASEVMPAAKDHDVEVNSDFRKPREDRQKEMLDRIVDVRPAVLYIHWSAPNQTVSASVSPPTPFWYGEDLMKLTIIDLGDLAPLGTAPAYGSVLAFKRAQDLFAHKVVPTSHAAGLIKVAYVRVVETKSTLTLRWQDGRVETEDSKSLVPYRNVDEYESWPGEHVWWRGDDGERRHVVVQSMNPHQRVAEVLFFDTKEKQTVSLLELDTGSNGVDEYGVDVGCTVLLKSEGDIASSQPPVVDDIGLPFPSSQALSEWEGNLEHFLNSYHKNPSQYGYFLPQGDSSNIEWIATVIDIHLDGSVTIKFANGKTKLVQLEELGLLNLPGMPDDGEGSMSGDEGDIGMGEDIMEGFGMTSGPNGMMMFMGGFGMGPRPRAPRSDASWETMDEDMDVNDANDAEEWRDGMEVEEELTPDVEDAPSIPEPKASIEEKPEVTVSGPSKSPPRASSSNQDEQWQSFDVLEEAPDDHYYIKEPRLQASTKSYHSRLQKEHRALSTSLPENILVRTYEDRTDLMRCLIIGPEGTPYADAPFIFDIYLNPTTFPNEPPRVHFHSHTNGHGRCNPNLYEEGKVCLSILGTWQGDRSESWSSTGSSLLQVMVSISGLVLVRSPYHCEPAFAKLKGTKEGKLNSRLYSEKAYVLSRSFVKTAFDRPPKGLEAELKYLYLTQGRLRTVLDHAKRLIEMSEASSHDDGAAEEDEEMWNADAIGSLSLGAGLSLKRTIASLEGILAKHES